MLSSEMLIYVVTGTIFTVIAIILGFLYIYGIPTFKKTRRRDSIDDLLVKEEPDTDLLDYYEHLQSRWKESRQKVVQKELQEGMTEEQRAKESDVQKEQLAAIFKLVESQNDKFGINSFDDVKEQMKLYSGSGI